ncbi:MAG TPA: VCBS repeat-containing protein [Kofleriaceae bacterium]|nr:VCBS repeat-containing protein [Kofleriaceae bacterium]
MTAACVDPGGAPSASEATSTAASNLVIGATPTYYPVSDSQNPLGLEGEIEAYGPMTAVADFNNDGVADLAIENNYTAVMIRLGDGSGGYGAESRYDLGGVVRPNAVIAQDLNSDGNLDLVTSNQASLSVLLGAGDGTFRAPTSYAITGCSGQPCYGSVAAADVNGDGRLDLAVGESGGVGVLLGNGDGTFGPLTTFPCGTAHHNSVTAADFTGDGKLDLASAASYGSAVYLFAGNGNGTFSGCAPTMVGSRPQSMTTGDWNHDGRPDLATANSWGVSVTVLQNQGNGTFATKSYPFAGREFEMLFVGAAHVDADGTLDLLVGHQTSLFVMTGHPDGTFTTTDTVDLGEAARFVLAGNFDRDPLELTDLLVSSDLGRLALLHGEPDAPPCTSGCTLSVVGSTQAATLVAPGAGSGLTIARPSLLRAGDVLYAFLTKNDDAGTISAPAGWTQLGQWHTTVDDDFTTGVWRKIVTASAAEPASYSWTHTDTTEEAMSGYIVAVRGANTAAPEDAPVAHASGTNDPTPDSPSVTTVSPSSLVLVHQGVTRTAMSAVVAPPGAGLLAASKGTDRNSGLAYFRQVAPGATGSKTWPNTGGAAAADWHTVTVAVRPL